MDRAIKERPILFTGPMVRSLIDGSKTQTRRIVKQNGQSGNAVYTHPVWQVRPTAEPRFNGHSHDFWRPGAERAYSALPPCPYGNPGARLWVRENWHQRGEWRLPCIPGADEDDAYWSGADDVIYAADAPRPDRGWRARPSIHMPRWASRILLEITGVRVERLQDIGTEDIEAEGVATSDEAIMEHGCRARVIDYQRLWESINGAGSWDVNPWVWCVSFRRVAP